MLSRPLLCTHSDRVSTSLFVLLCFAGDSGLTNPTALTTRIPTGPAKKDDGLDPNPSANSTSRFRQLVSHDLQSIGSGHPADRLCCWGITLSGSRRTSRPQIGHFNISRRGQTLPKDRLNPPLLRRRGAVVGSTPSRLSGPVAILSPTASTASTTWQHLIIRGGDFPPYMLDGKPPPDLHRPAGQRCSDTSLYLVCDPLFRQSSYSNYFWRAYSSSPSYSPVPPGLPCAAI